MLADLVAKLSQASVPVLNGVGCSTIGHPTLGNALHNHASQLGVNSLVAQVGDYFALVHELVHNIIVAHCDGDRK